MTGQDEWMTMQGDLDMDTVPALFESGLKRLSSTDLQVDFAQVDSVDSAAVSMLLGWARAAQRGQRTLKVKNLPDDLLSLARLYGVADLIPQQSV